MIKQIQLRGISRSPSDRVTSDGGLSESLNMYLDSAESAPVFEPDDVTQQIKLPSDLEAEKIFIHKTANYENYIVIQKDKVVAYTPDIIDEEPLFLLDITGKEINNLSSLGNTVVITSDLGLYYFLFKDRKYVYLGNGVPFPQITFDKEEADAPIEINYTHRYAQSSVGTNQSSAKWEDLWFGQGNISNGGMVLANDLQMGRLPEEEEWTKENFVFNEGDSKDEKPLQYEFDKFKDHINSLLADAYKEVKKQRRLSGNIFVRYAIELYSGALYSSMPILIKGKNLNIEVSQYTNIFTQESLDLNGESYDDGPYHLVSSWSNTAKTSLIPYDIYVSCADVEKLKEWRELIKSINIYISVPANFWVPEYYVLNERVFDTYVFKDGLERDLQHTESSGSVTMGEQFDEEMFLLEQSSQTYLVKSIPVLDERGAFTEEFLKLSEKHKLEIEGELLEQDKLREQTRLTKDDMKHYPLGASTIDSFNNSFLLPNPTAKIIYDYSRLNTYSKYRIESTSAPKSYGTRYDVAFVVRGDTEDKVVLAQNFNVKHTSNGSIVSDDDYFAFQTFPDSRAYKMIVKATRVNMPNGKKFVKYGEFDMIPHPYLNCAYFYGGIDARLYSLCDKETLEMPMENSLEDSDNKLCVSDLNDPFTFPIEKRYAFQSKVVGVAVATTALSQGQFGQFPLYVFTEDGIWVMETGADGSFVSQKPLSREVCSNPYSITSIDKAVVFVTKKGVMLIHGAEVINLSEHMNGRHFIPNDDALGLVNKLEGYKQFDDAIKDEDPFMTFMQDARVAYDYPGERLIFMSPSNQDFQYVYKINTKTWHKQSFENIQLVTPLNSYPNCLVLGKSKVKELWIDTPRSDGEALNYISIIQEVFSRYEVALSEDRCYAFATQDIGIDVSMIDEMDLEFLVLDLESVSVFTHISQGSQKVFSLSTILDASRQQTTAKGVIITRPFDLDEPDVYKTIKNVKIRGDFDKGNVKYFLQGSDDGRTFYNLTSLRGKSWKMFRLFILTDLEPTERISWVDIDYEVRFKNRLR